MENAIVETEGLTKVFNRSLVAVDHVNFEVRKGEIFGFLGPNGAGKTTTINMLITVLRPTEGNAVVCGFDVMKQAKEVRSCIGIVPQEYTANDDLTGWENIILCGDLYGIPRGVSKERAEELLKLVELTDFRNKKVQTYSGGMRRRLELACGLINRPRVLFLDEPTLGLDVQTRTATWNYITLLKEEYDMTVFMTTHYLEEADALCERVAIIDHGKIVKLDTPNALKESLGGDIVTVGARAVMNLLNLPLLFASNTLFPTSLMPSWLQDIAKLNPVSYATDASRQFILYPIDVGQIVFDFTVLGVFAVVFSIIGIVLSWRYLSK